MSFQVSQNGDVTLIVLVSLSKKIREQGGELRLSSLNDDLRTLFELTKLDTLFKIADDKAQALEGF